MLQIEYQNRQALCKKKSDWNGQKGLFYDNNSLEGIEFAAETILES